MDARIRGQEFRTQFLCVGSEAFIDPVVARAGPQFTDFVKNTYRVLLTRGMKGCYVHFMDNDTERFVRSHMAPT